MRIAARLLPLLALFLLTGPAVLALAEPAETELEPEGMFELYEQNRERGIPNYVTEDFLLLAYSMLLNETMTEIEERHLAPRLRAFVEALGEALAEAPNDEVTRANRSFLTVVGALLADDGARSAELPPAVAQELERIMAAGGIAASELMAQTLDYSQFRVRGRYTRSAELGRYFRAARYAGTVLFPVVASKATGIGEEDADRLTAQAFQLTGLIVENAEIATIRDDLNDRVEWLFGPSDDLRVDDYRRVAAEGPDLALPQLRSLLLERARETGRRPQVLAGLVEVDQLEEGLEARDVLTGWRLFPQRYTPDAAAFQQLVFDRVGVYLGEGRPRTLSHAGGLPVKGFPSALELMALLGSEEAARRLDATDERNYEGYAEAAGRAGRLLADAPGLAGDHLSLMRFWLGASGSGSADSPRRLNSALSFWTYQRYNSLLYAKQSYTGSSKGFAPLPDRGGAWLEPAAELYARLAGSAVELAARFRSPEFAAFAELLERCIRIAVVERAGLPLQAEDVDFLNGLDAELLRLVGRNDAPIVVDVHTDPAS
ncbi:MAG: DUF3160 domain-containing protein, partial [bacterium]|nr:DUF3160 domain-containing protein [bacterium]